MFLRSGGSNRGAATRPLAAGQDDSDEECDEDARQKNEDGKGGRGHASARGADGVHSKISPPASGCQQLQHDAKRVVFCRGLQGQMKNLQGEQEMIQVVYQDGVSFHERMTIIEVAKAGSPAHQIFCECLQALFSAPEHAVIHRGRKGDDVGVYGRRLSAPLEQLRRLLEARGAWQLALVLVGSTRGGSFCWKVLSSTISLSICKMPATICVWMLASVVCINKPSPRSFRSSRSLHMPMYAHITALLTSSRSKTHSLSSHILQISDNEKKPAVCEPLFLRTITRKHVQYMLRHIPVRRDDMWQNSVDSALKGLPRPSSLR
jgi:hypothetical protein